LEQAIRTIGGVSELARRVGVAQPSVSNWTRVPAERVAAVEAATGVSRAILRPDLFATVFGGDKIDEVVPRAQEYALISALLVKAPSADAGAASVRRRRVLSSASRTYGKAGRTRGTSMQYFDLFIGVGRGELLPYASYYLTGFLHERPLARLRGDLFLLGVERAEDNPDPEDHIAFLCEIMLVIGKHFGMDDGATAIFDSI
jgi:DNA-binding transcriptional regulator YdaS (Cro superfamily)